MNRRFRLLAGFVVLALLALAATACGGDDTKDSSDGNIRLRILGPTVATAAQAPFYLALQAGYFKDEGLDVTYSFGPDTNVGATMVSGGADVGMTGMNSALLLTQQGKPTVTVMNHVGGGASLFVAGDPSYQSVTDCKTVLSSVKGGNSYGAAVAIKRLFGAEFEIADKYASSDLIISAALTGKGDCVVGAYSILAPIIEKRKMKLLVDPRDKASLPAGWPTTFIESSFWVMRDKLSSSMIQDGLPRFLAAIERARTELLDKKTPDELATMLQQNKDFAAQDHATLVNQLQVFRGFQLPANGYIDEDSWQNTVQFYINGGIIPGPADDPRFDFDENVDMSFFPASSR